MEEYFNGIHSVLIRLEIELYEIKQYLIVSTSQELALTRYQPQHQRRIQVPRTTFQTHHCRRHKPLIVKAYRH